MDGTIAKELNYIIGKAAGASRDLDMGLTFLVPMSNCMQVGLIISYKKTEFLSVRQINS